MADMNVTVYEPTESDIPVINLRYVGGTIASVEVVVSLRTSATGEATRKRSVGIALSELTGPQQTTLNNVVATALSIAKTKLGF